MLKIVTTCKKIVICAAMYKQFRFYFIFNVNLEVTLGNYIFLMHKIPKQGAQFFFPHKFLHTLMLSEAI